MACVAWSRLGRVVFTSKGCITVAWVLLAPGVLGGGCAQDAGGDSATPAAQRLDGGQAIERDSASSRGGQAASLATSRSGGDVQETEAGGEATGGAAQQEAATSSSDGGGEGGAPGSSDAAQSTPDGVAGDGVAADAGMPIGPFGPLGETPPGEAPSFDPDAVYLIAPRSDQVVPVARPINAPPGGLPPQPLPIFATIAPIADPDDHIAVLPLTIAFAQIRRDDARLIYHPRYAQTVGWPERDVLREFVRDEIPDPPYQDAVFLSELPDDPVVDGAASCEEVSEEWGSLDPWRAYVVGWDGHTYHACAHPVDQAVRPTALGMLYDHYAWYEGDGTPIYEGDVWIHRVGPQQRAFGVRALGDGIELVVFDLHTGSVLGRVDPSEDLAGEGTPEVMSVRMRADGFWVAFQISPRDDEFAGVDLRWLDLDLDGAVLDRGAYAALPAGVTIDQISWGRGSAAAIDGQGRAHQIAQRIEDRTPVVVRRPMRGQSDVRYEVGDAPDRAFLAPGWSALVSGG